MAKKLDEQTKIRIAMLHRKGVKHSEIQAHLGVCRSTVGQYKDYKPKPTRRPRHGKPITSDKLTSDKLRMITKNINVAADIIKRIDPAAFKTPIAPEPIKLPITMTVTPKDLFTAWNRLALLAKVAHIEIGG